MRPGQANALHMFIRTGGRLTGRQVARILGSPSPSGTRDVLLQLVRVGLLVAEPSPQATYYSLNTDHLLWPAIERVSNSIEQFEEAVQEATRSSAPAGTSVLLYGSTARTRSTADSDVDLLVVFPDTVAAEARDDFSAVLAALVQRKTGNRAEVFDLTATQLDDLINDDDPMVDSWRSDARLLAGPPLRSGFDRVA